MPWRHVCFQTLPNLSTRDRAAGGKGETGESDFCQIPAISLIFLMGANIYDINSHTLFAEERIFVTEMLSTVIVKVLIGDINIIL